MFLVLPSSRKSTLSQNKRGLNGSCFHGCFSGPHLQCLVTRSRGKSRNCSANASGVQFGGKENGFCHQKRDCCEVSAWEKHAGLWWACGAALCIFGDKAWGRLCLESDTRRAAAQGPHFPLRHGSLPSALRVHTSGVVRSSKYKANQHIFLKDRMNCFLVGGALFNNNNKKGN